MNPDHDVTVEVGRQGSVTMSPGPDAPAEARAFVSAHVGAIPSTLLSDVLVLVSELVTNAVRYGEGEIEVRLTASASTVQVRVHDSGDALPEIADRPPSPLHTSGRGLQIVAALATRWGIRPTTEQAGKTVWCELDTSAT